MRMRGLASGVLTLAMLWVGVAQAHNTPQEEANKKLVRDFYNALDEPQTEGTARERVTRINEKYIAPDYIQHSVNGQGAPGAQRRGGGAAPPPNGPPKMGPAKLLSITAEGDRVIQVTSRTIPDSTGKPVETIIFNMFRVKDGKLIEHWDAFGVPSEPPSNSSAPK